MQREAATHKKNRDDQTPFYGVFVPQGGHLNSAECASGLSAFYFNDFAFDS